MDRGILMYESSLGSETRKRLDGIGWAEVVIGIPSHRNARTIGEVVRAVIEGVARYLPQQRVLIMNADGGSSDNTTRFLNDAAVPDHVEKLVATYEGPMGKGIAIRAILEASTALEARACLLVDARAPGITPEWVPALVNPVLGGQEMAVAYYQRSAYGAGFDECLGYPFLRSFFRSDLRNPLAGELCLAGPLAAELAGRDVWETDVARFGINAWLTTVALAEERRMVQVPVGERGEPSGEPGLLGDARLMHAAGTLFRTLSIYRRLWQHQQAAPRRVPIQGSATPDRAIPSSDCLPQLEHAFHEGKRVYLAEWERVLMPETLDAVLRIAPDDDAPVELGPDLWARAALEFAVMYNRGEGDPDRVVESLLPLYYARVATHVRNTDTLTVAERSAYIEEMAAAFARARPHFVERWDQYESWFEAAGSWL